MLRPIQPFVGFSRLCSYALLVCSLVQAQYIQDYQYLMRNGKTAPFWRRTALDPLDFVVIPTEIVALYYNCHYMPAICQNNINWLGTNRAQTRSLAVWAGAAGSNVYGFDINSRATDPRGDRMCPRNWLSTHSCPERDPQGQIIQPDVMPGPWPHKARETVDPLHLNEIAADYTTDANGNQILLQRSGRYYTCEEWPPRSFVEGGIGTPGQNVMPEGDGGRGNTFCAPQLINANCADEAPAWDEAIKSEQDWQGNAHRVVATRLRAIARQEAGRTTPAQQDNTAVLVALLFFNDPNEAPAGFTMGPGGSITYDVDLYKNTKRADNYIGHLSPKEQVQAMANLTWEQVRQWRGQHFAVQLNGTVTSSNVTDVFAEEKAAVDDFSALGGAYMHDQGLQLASNESIHGIASNTSGNLSHLRFAVSNVSTNSTEPASLLSEGVAGLQRGHREPRSPIPYDPLGLGTAYILGNIGDDSNLPSHQNSSSSLTDLQQSNNTVTDRSVSESRRAHFRRHAGAHLNQASHQHATNKFGMVSGGSSPIQSLNNGITPFALSLHKRDGPTQCGPGSPCKDDSCCSAEGKCGYKAHNCGAGCTSNCDAKAMCGIDSADGKTKCGLNLCCSYYGWCGTEDVHCYDPEPQFGKTPCQQGFGSCQKYPSPSCGGRSASTGRRVGYYQGWNVRERKCDKVSPSQINTKGLTHLFYSFVFFDPTTFNIIPMNAADPPVYREFTKLATNGLQTWVAIGGWSFSDPGIYHTAWSDMCSSASNRAAFIRSTIAFMDQYGFQGADLDWEYPEDAKRGGKPGDADNLVLLVKEMQAAFAGRYGLSLTLAPDYWYLRGFKPKAMEPYVDFMGFMSYDLHGPWDTDVKALGSIVRPQTDITEIYQNFKPLWFDGVDPKKINMGLAYYGRTYKLADASCGSMGCRFTGPGAAGECTAFEGVLSNREIQAMIKKDGLKPYFNQTAMVKYVTYAGNSWVGYDDAETLALKEGFANSLCLGGLMIWSIDFDAGTGAQLPGDSGNDKDLVWVSPDIWKQPNPQVYCQFPCTVVLPPYQGVTATTAYPPVTVTSSGFTTTVTRPPVTISVWWISTLVIGPTTSGDGPKTVTSAVTLLTTTTWPAFTTTDSSGRLIYTSATDTRRPPPPYITSAVPSITFISGLPPRPTTTPYPTPCTRLPGLCDPGEEENDEPEDEDDNGDGDCKGEDCDSGGCGSSCGGCKLGLLCNVCIGFKCLGCIGLDCVSCKGPLCNICIGANCTGCKGPKCATCKGKDCVSCTKGKCGSPTCTDLQCQPGTDPDPDEEEEEEEDDGKCYWRRDTLDNPWGWDNDDGGGGIIPGNGGGSNTQTGGGSPTATGGSGGSTPKPSTPAIQKPDFSSPSTNTNKCYDDGQKATREHMVQAAESFCKTYDGVVFGSSSYQAALVGFGWQEVHKSGLNILVRLEAKNNCEWTMNKDECNKQFVALIDGCDQEGIIDKQGGVRENNCLMWRIDPEQNTDVQAPAPPPPKPSSPPAPEQPKTPEIKEGNRPRFDIYTSSLYLNPGGPGVGTWVFGRQAISYYGEYRVCLASYGWSEDDNVSTTDMPNDIKGITKVFGKTCDYTNGGLADRIIYDKAKVGDVVGYLNCEGWATAKCYKENKNFSCFGAGMFLRTTCYW